MNDLIEMALDAGFLQKSASTFLCNTDCLKAFEALVRADERKQIALDKKAENARELGLEYEPVLVHPTAQEMQNAAANLALMREMWGDPNQPAAKVNDEGFIVETGLLLSPGTLLYTTPPTAQRQWVNLTDEQMRQVWYDDALVEGGTYIDKLRQVEAKLKDENNG